MAKSITVLLYMTIFYFVSQPEANYTIIRLFYIVDTFIATHALHEVYIQTFKQPFIKKSMQTYTNKHKQLYCYK